MSTVKQRGAEFWDANPCGGEWDSYHSFLNWMRRTEPYLYQVLDAHPWASCRVLEVGCGQGTTLNDLPTRGASVVGFDMSAQSLRQARSGAAELGHSAHVRFTQADAENLPAPDNAFDVVVSAGVLHHTPDTVRAVREVRRVLRPGGRVIVMLYRSGNPKWWATWALRAVMHGVDRVTGEPGYLARRLRTTRRAGAPAGTALLELFGVPVLKAFSNQQARAMFSGFVDIYITNYQPGFYRLVDIVPGLRWLAGPLAAIDRRMQTAWGFYQVIEAVKPL